MNSLKKNKENIVYINNFISIKKKLMDIDAVSKFDITYDPSSRSPMKSVFEIASKHFGLITFTAPIRFPKMFSRYEMDILCQPMTTRQQEAIALNNKNKFIKILKECKDNTFKNLTNLIYKFDEFECKELDSLDFEMQTEIRFAFSTWMTKRINHNHPTHFSNFKNYPEIFNMLTNKILFLKNEISNKWSKIDRDIYIDFSNYEKMFPLARKISRKLIFHAGPTNSGKTHQALEELKKARSGVYLAPLRLMAMENYDRLIENDIRANMITGEEQFIFENSTHVSQTIETLDTSSIVDVAVIDEIQLIADADRGWAWTQAAIGVPARTVIMTGSIDALPYLKKISEMTGEELIVIPFERKCPLDVMQKTLTLNELEKGDAVIAFSRSAVLSLKDDIIRRGHSISVVYGALSPEVRRAEAKRFRRGETDIIVATDAIGMGLNLPIRRVVFSSLEKFDGRQRRFLEPSEIRQIGGRAGRHGFHESGEITVLSPQSSSLLKQLYDHEHPIDIHPTLFVMPPWSLVDHMSKKMDTSDLHFLLITITNLLSKNSNIRIPSISSSLECVAATANSGLTLEERYSYLGLPINFRKKDVFSTVRHWAHLHGHNKNISPPKFDHLSNLTRNHDVLDTYEQAVSILSAWLWLSSKFPDIYINRQFAIMERQRINEIIEKSLMLRKKKIKLKPIK